MCPSVQPGRSLHSADTGGKQQWPLATVPVSPRQLPSCNDPVENVQPYFKMKSHFSQYFSGPMGRENSLKFGLPLGGALQRVAPRATLRKVQFHHYTMPVCNHIVFHQGVSQETLPVTASGMPTQEARPARGTEAGYFLNFKCRSWLACRIKCAHLLLCNPGPLCFHLVLLSWAPTLPSCCDGCSPGK